MQIMRSWLINESDDMKRPGKTTQILSVWTKEDKNADDMRITNWSTPETHTDKIKAMIAIRKEIYRMQKIKRKKTLNY